jgi:hypothetical protein
LRCFIDGLSVKKPPIVDEVRPEKKKTHPSKRVGQEDEEDVFYRILPKKTQRRQPMFKPPILPYYHSAATRPWPSALRAAAPPQHVATATGFVKARGELALRLGVVRGDAEEGGDCPCIARALEDTPRLPHVQPSLSSQMEERSERIVANGLQPIISVYPPLPRKAITQGKSAC